MTYTAAQMNWSNEEIRTISLDEVCLNFGVISSKQITIQQHKFIFVK